MEQAMALGLRPRIKGRLIAIIMAVATMAASIGIATAPNANADHKTSPTLYECALYAPTLYEGVSGQDGCVVTWQVFMKDFVYEPLVVGGDFGPVTRYVTAAWQLRNPPLAADGIVGPQTWKLIRYMCQNDNGYANWCFVYRFRYH